MSLLLHFSNCNFTFTHHLQQKIRFISVNSIKVSNAEEGDSLVPFLVLLIFILSHVYVGEFSVEETRV